MKLALVSDLHIGYDRFYDDAYKQAKEALEAASAAADAILIAGDIFDKRAPKPEVIAQAINIFRELSRKHWAAQVVDFRNGDGKKIHTRVPIIAIPGTHERTAEGKENVLELLSLAGLLVDASESTVTVEKEGERVSVFALGGISEERVREVLERLGPKPVSGSFNVFMFHQSVYELLPFSDDFIHYDDLPKGFDLYYNGHIHSKVEAEVHGKKFLIPGSTVLTQLKDGEQEKKGFILFDTKSATYEFKTIPSRTFVARHIKVDSVAPKELVEKCESEIEKALATDKDKPIVKLYLEGTVADGFNTADMPLHTLSARYSERCYLDIDYSKLTTPDLEKDIEELRGNRIGESSVKELGMRTFLENLKGQKFDDRIDAARLFEILSSNGNKEKIMKEVNDYISSLEN